MGKILGYVLILYGLYYVGNIIYDLFLAKEKVDKNDEDGETISLADLDVTNDYQDNEIYNVVVDDVESVQMPLSYDIEEEKVSYGSDKDEQFDHLKKTFEEEESFDWYNQEEIEKKKDLTKSENVLKNIVQNVSKNVVSEKKIFFKNNEEETNLWKGFIEKASTSVLMTENDGGHKTFRSTL